MVASGKLYFGADYTWKLGGKATITAVYNGKDYKNPEPATNPASGVMKMKSGCKLTVSSDLVIDDIILFQEGGQNTIHVTAGATLTITENVITTTKTGEYMTIIVATGGKVVINGGTFDAVGGYGEKVIGEKAQILKEEGEAEKETVQRAVSTYYVDAVNGSDNNDGKSVTAAKKKLSSAVADMTIGGEVYIHGKTSIGEYSFPVLPKNLLISSENGKSELAFENNANVHIYGDVSLSNITVSFGSNVCINVHKGATLQIDNTVKVIGNANVVLDDGAYAHISQDALAVLTISGNGDVIPYVDGDSDILAHFAGIKSVVKLTIGSTTAYINGVAQTLDAAPINRNNRTMLPVRFLANAFGVTNDGIKWDAATRTATLTNATTTIVVTIDAPTMTVNGETVALDSPAIIESNRTYLPVRAIATALGVSNDNIAWDSATNTATLVK